jgi:Flp pilus assembly protein TadD
MGKDGVRKLAALLALLESVACARGAPPVVPTNGAAVDRDAVVEAAQRALAAGDRRTARALFERVLMEHPSDDEARTGIARLDAWDGRWKEAERAHRELLARHPYDEEIRAGLIDLMLWQRRFDEADALIEDGLHRTPSSGVLLERKATLLYWRGDPTAARDVADHAQAVAPDDPEIRSLREKLFQNEVRSLLYDELYPHGYPDVRGVELAYLRRWRRLSVTALTQQLVGFSDVPGRGAYNGAYTLGLAYAIAAGWSIGVEGGGGAPAPSIPVAKARLLVTAPLPWRLSSSASYAFWRYASGLSIHMIRPAIGVAFDDDTSAEVAYLLTVAAADASAGHPLDIKPLHGVSAQIERQIGTLVRLKLGYAHGAEADLAPASSQLLELVSNAAWAGAAFRASSTIGFYPLYRIQVWTRDAAPSIVSHTVELGATARW